MKRFIIALVVVFFISACSQGNFVDSLEKQYLEIKEYRAEYTVIMNDSKFKVIEEYQNKGEYHLIQVDSKQYQQEIELNGDKVILRNTNHDEVIEGKRGNFNLPAFVLIEVLGDIVANKDTITIVSEDQIDVNNGQYRVTYEGKEILKVELEIGGSEIVVEYDRVEFK